MQTRRSRYSKNINIVFFFLALNFELTSIKQKTLHKQWSSHKNTHYNLLSTHFSLHLNFIFTCEYKLAQRKSPCIHL